MCHYKSIFLYETYSESIPIPFTILLKFPSRSRPERLLSTFQSYLSYAYHPEHIRCLITLDEDDETVTSQLQEQLRTIHPGTTIIIGTSTSKINAVNRDMEHAGPYDILVLASDDMIPVVRGYDTIIRNHMNQFYPDTDGVLWYNDGYKGSKLNTLCILGKTYYERFHYIYHPSYRSFYCDNEFMMVADRLGKQTYFEEVIIRHDHPHANTLVVKDELYRKNDTFARHDVENFIKRKANGFPK